MPDSLDEGKRARFDAQYGDPNIGVYTENSKSNLLTDLEDKKVQRSIVDAEREIAQATDLGKGIGAANVKYNPLTGIPEPNELTKLAMLALAFYLTGIV